MISLDATRDLFHLFGDPTRVRLAALLARHELTVAELTAITDLPQSRISTHLGKLREAGALRDRRNGASTLYALNDGAMPPEVRTIWSVLAKEVDDPLVAEDRRRCEVLIKARTKREAWPDAVAGEMERHYSPGRTWESAARAFLGFARLGDVLDAGSGDGAIAQLVAPRARSLTCLDQSERLLGAARTRLAGVSNVRFLRGDLHAIPAAEDSFDHVMCLNVLTHARMPARAAAEIARVLRPGGRATLVALDAHRQPGTTATYGHVHPGFTPAAIRAMLVKAGLVVETCAVTSRERREPHFRVVTAFAYKPEHA